MRLKNRYVAVLAVLTLFIAGCSHNLVGRMSGDGSAESTVTFSVTDIPTNYDAMIHQAQNPAPRSILPNAPFNYTSARFFLTGTSNSGEIFPSTEVTLDASHQFTQNLSAHVWDLTLTGYKGPDTDNIKVLIGHCTIDLTTTNGTATFKMSTKGLTTPGTVKVSGTVKDPDSLCTYYEMAIYNAYSGKLITEYTPIGASAPTPIDTVKTETSITHSGTPATFTFTYEKTPAVTLNAGVYDYRMVFYKGTPGSGTVIGSWSDALVVDPGCDLDQNIGTIDPLNKKPEPPAHLRAYLVNNSEDTEGRYFYTKLTWEKGKYETNYELRLTPYSGNPLTQGTPVIYGFKSTYTTPPTDLEEFVTSPIYHSGNLIYGSEECTLKLELGKVYDVEIRAHNYLGEAPAATWVARETSGGTVPANCTLFDGTNGSHISRYRITYNLNGGELILSGQPTNKPIQGTYSEYQYYTGTPVSLMTITATPSPLPGTATDNYLTRGAVAFTGWGKLPSAPPYTPTPLTTYNGYENIIVTAAYGHSFNGSVDLESLTEMDPGNIVFEYGDGSLASLTPVTPDASLNVSIPKKTGTPLQNTWVKISFKTPATPATEAYSNMHCTLYLSGNGMYINKVDILSASDGKSCVFSTQEYIPQKITVQVKAENKTHQTVGKTFFINLY